MSFLEQIFSDRFIFSLGWTLIHSLWQGALIGLVIALLMVFLYRYTAKLRYFIYSISLFVMAGLAIVTFIGSFLAYDADDLSSIGSSEFIFTENAVSAAAFSDNEANSLPDILEMTAVYCRTHFPLFVGIWLLGMLAMLLRFLGGYALVRRYRSHRVKPVMGEWEQKFMKLADRINVNRNVRLLESALVKVPMAIGYLKPIVLLPLGAINGVPAEQMEAILAHELAHIRRSDYLVNMIQSILEVVFFYHPVSWWLSKNIRIERENICDDIAITITGNKMEFAKALTNIQDISLAAPGLAAGLSGKNKNRLVNRIRRLAGKPKIHSGYAEGFIAASILMISMLGLSAAAMINYPVTEPFPMELGFDDSGISLPGMKFYQTPAASPDTIVKHVSKAEEEIILPPDSNELLEKQLEELEEKMENDLQAVELQLLKEQAELARVAVMAAREEKQSELLQSEVFTHEMQKTMEEYRAALEETHNRMKEAQWGMVDFSDSTAWHSYPSNFEYFNDSLHDIYYDQWSDKYTDYLEFNEQYLNEMAKLEEHMKHLNLKNHYLLAEPIIPQWVDGNYDFSSNFVSSSRASRIIEDELREDGLIDRGREYIILIDKRQILINGEKQSRTVFKKYRRLVDSMQDEYFSELNDPFKVYIDN